MKGPYLRLQYDMMRIWECPACSRRERTNGTSTTMLCDCVMESSKKMQSMRLIEDDIRRSGIVPPAALAGDQSHEQGQDGQNDG